MSTPPPSDVTPVLVVLVLFVLIIARRTYLMVQGTRYSTGRLFTFAAFYVLLFVAFAFTTLYAALGCFGSDTYPLCALYVAVPVAAAGLARPLVRRTVRFEERGDGQLYYRLPWHVPVLYLVLFVSRIVAEFAVFGLAGLLFTFPLPAPPSVGALLVLIVVDLLFGFSLGLLLGRGIGVYEAHRDLPTGAPPPSSPPLPSG